MSMLKKFLVTLLIAALCVSGLSALAEATEPNGITVTFEDGNFTVSIPNADDGWTANDPAEDGVVKLTGAELTDGAFTAAFEPIADGEATLTLWHLAAEPAVCDDVYTFHVNVVNGVITEDVTDAHQTAEDAAGLDSVICGTWTDSAASDIRMYIDLREDGHWPMTCYMFDTDQVAALYADLYYDCLMDQLVYRNGVLYEGSAYSDAPEGAAPAREDISGRIELAGDDEYSIILNWFSGLTDDQAEEEAWVTLQRDGAFVDYDATYNGYEFNGSDPWGNDLDVMITTASRQNVSFTYTQTFESGVVSQTFEDVALHDDIAAFTVEAPVGDSENTAVRYDVTMTLLDGSLLLEYTDGEMTEQSSEGGSTAYHVAPLEEYDRYVVLSRESRPETEAEAAFVDSWSDEDVMVDIWYEDDTFQVVCYNTGDEEQTGSNVWMYNACYYDEANDCLVCEDGTRYFDYYDAEADEYKSDIVVSGLTATFRFAEGEDKLIWDDSEGICKRYLLARYTFDDSADDETAFAAEPDYSGVTTLPAEEVEAFALTVKEMYLNADWAAMAEVMDFPVVVSGTELHDSEAFLTFMEGKTMSEADNAALSEDDCTNLFANGEGICLGSGQIWLIDVNFDGIDQVDEPQLRVFALNGLSD